MSGLADRFVPRADFGSRHQAVVPAPVEVVWAAWQAMEKNGDWGAATRVLFAVRRTLGRLRKQGREARPADLRNAFFPLAEDPPREMLNGIVGQWWTMGRKDGRVDVAGPEAFLAFDEPGYAKATFSMRFAEDPATGGTRIVTETRVLCTDDAARRAMGRYWRFVAPFSGVVRRRMLHRLRKRVAG